MTYASLHRPPQSCTHCNHLDLQDFCNLPPQTLAEMDAISMPVDYPSGSMLMRQGDPSEFVRILCHGRAKIYTTAPDGKVLLLKVVGSGAILGLLCTIKGIVPYQTTAEACEPCTVKAIRSKEFLDFLSRNHAACWHSFQELAEQTHALLLDTRRLALSGSVAGRLAKLLLDWEATTSQSYGTRHFNIALTHLEIAETIGSTRETVTRTLGQFRRDGWIRTKGVSVEILRRDKMEGISI